MAKKAKKKKAKSKKAKVERVSLLIELLSLNDVIDYCHRQENNEIIALALERIRDQIRQKVSLYNLKLAQTGVSKERSHGKESN